LTWKVEFLQSAERDLRRLERGTQHRILKFLRERIRDEEDPRRIGQAMVGHDAGRWRYRVGDYRLICQIQDENRRVLVLKVGHRREVYR
jgi:mRNA interferase RelE/StbE